MVKLSDLLAVDLRKELERRGLDKTGLKQVLVDRLRQAMAMDGVNTDTRSRSRTNTRTRITVLMTLLSAQRRVKEATRNQSSRRNTCPAWQSPRSCPGPPPLRASKAHLWPVRTRRKKYQVHKPLK